MQQYRRTLGLPGVRTLMIVMLFARIPVSAAGIVLMLHVAVGMDLGYGQAGLVGASATVGIAVGSPIMGRVVDRYGLRRLLMIVTVGETAFWASARFMNYGTLLALAFFGGFLVIPAMSIGRQAIAAAVTADLRRTAYSLDSVSTELTFMIGPAAAVALSTQLSTSWTLTAMAVAAFLSGTLLFVINPKMRADHEEVAGGRRLPLREWLTPRLLGVLAVGAGAIFVLASIDVAVVAALRETGQLEWTGLVIAITCVASAVGGVVYGTLRKPFEQFVLMGLMSLFILPVGIASGQWWWLLALALIPATALCAPTLAATNEKVSSLAPASMRGVATGLQSSAFTLGAAAGTPLVGFVVDHGSPAWGFAVAGAGGLVVAGVAAATWHFHEKVNVGSRQEEPSELCLRSAGPGID
ncbi:Predicted arabinose efflux permease, MFS family [Actinokineospora alba]|uniref:Predicted arabinose efflux permease, MFS family n=1 Tax=Actinokineospora alba TaxID=504798 RepID=A0A1H0T3F7_9PSEU|nr:MFS transporter [Actinokineospora alba]TDP66406.1 putative MFS family arabinose efflux permease [Actinokineospora alba]SDJ24343.1 Predicted arabinose efflux permease, MFS family [Actinokineospora alba]SDP48068.1 Predicted arabinose efflux permease, MFS family [Actinokineospora alba]